MMGGGCAKALEFAFEDALPQLEAALAIDKSGRHDGFRR